MKFTSRADTISLEFIRNTTFLSGYRPEDGRALTGDLYFIAEWIDARRLDTIIEIHVRNARESFGSLDPGEDVCPSHGVDSVDPVHLDSDGFLLKTVERVSGDHLSIQFIWNRLAAEHEVNTADTGITAGARAWHIAKRFSTLLTAPDADRKGRIDPGGPSEHYWTYTRYCCPEELNWSGPARLQAAYSPWSPQGGRNRISAICTALFPEEIALEGPLVPASGIERKWVAEHIGSGGRAATDEQD